MRAGWRVPLIVGVSVTGPFWLAAAALLLASWRSSVAEDWASDAPTCASSQVFTETSCRITLPGTMTKITSGELDVTVDGRSIRSAVTLAGNLPHTPHGIPVQVTIYRGRVIHVEDEAGLFVDTNAAPGTKSLNYLNFGICCLVGGALFGALSVAKTIEARKQAPSAP